MSAVMVALVLFTGAFLALVITATVITTGNDRRRNAEWGARWAGSLYRQAAPVVRTYVVPVLVEVTHRLTIATTPTPAPAPTPVEPPKAPVLLGACSCPTAGACRASTETPYIPGALIRPGQPRLEGRWACIYPKETR